MSAPRGFILRWLVALLLPLLLMEGLRWAAGSEFSALGFGLRLGFVLLAFGAALMLNRAAQRTSLALVGWVLALILVWPAAPWLPPGGLPLTVYACLWLSAIFAAPLSQPARWRVFAPLREDLASRTWGARVFQPLVTALFSACAALLIVYTLGLTTRFSEEEFFMGLQIAGLGVVGLALYLALWRVAGPVPRLPKAERDSRLPGMLVLGTAALILVLVPLALVRTYQQSFFSSTAPAYLGLNPESPFECQVLSTENEAGYAGAEVFDRLLDGVEANPRAAAPEFGMLALGRQNLDWAERYRTAMLAEAAQGRFTGPANSIKYGQYEAALRIYYYPHLLEAFPSLFSQEDQHILRAWFAAINRRTLTPEWVDWMYGLAFNRWLEGPYENQESGAGLLALLEAYGLADPALAQQNRAYLDREQRGWQARFRNTDDAVIYQPEWIYNALFQSLYEQTPPPQDAVRRSFEWITAQARPTGAPLGYNHVAPISLGGIAYLGAVLLEDTEMLWISGRALDYLAAHEGRLSAVPGAETQVDFSATPPGMGSCLLYGDSGLPTTIGPLAADKIVLRRGWEPEDPYLLLNLRFTGWHRYKATGAIIAIDQGGPLAVEQLSGEQAAWLPSGRSLFRDKRLPRENLNALLIPQAGLARMMVTLTGAGSPWAQDPPFYAQVAEFTAGETYSAAEIITPGWNGWEHFRRVHLDAAGPVVVYDYAAGPGSETAAVAWHLVTEAAPGGPLVLLAPQAVHRVPLPGSEAGGPAEVLLIPLEAGRLLFTLESQGITGVQYLPQRGGELKLITVFLAREWVGAAANLSHSGKILLLDNGMQSIAVPFENQD
jgi:hypothetical protein